MRNQDGLRLWWLIRGDVGLPTYVLDAYVTTDRHNQGGQLTFESTILGLEDRVFGAGETAYEAEYSAMRLLHDLLEDALASNTLESSLGDVKGLSVKPVQRPFQEVVELIREFSEIKQVQTPNLVSPEASSRVTWSASPASAEPAELCAQS